MYEIIITKEVKKFIDKHPIEWRKITEFSKKVAISPFPTLPNVIKLVWRKNIFRARIGKYRILYKVLDDDKIIVFTEADSRWDIYK